MTALLPKVMGDLGLTFFKVIIFFVGSLEESIDFTVAQLLYFLIIILIHNDRLLVCKLILRLLCIDYLDELRLVHISIISSFLSLSVILNLILWVWVVNLRLIILVICLNLTLDIRVLADLTGKLDFYLNHKFIPF